MYTMSMKFTGFLHFDLNVDSKCQCCSDEQFFQITQMSNIFVFKYFLLKSAL